MSISVTRMKDKIEALPCPWCGDADYLQVIDSGTDGRRRKNVWCPSCDVVGPEHPNDYGAIETWNRRASK